MAPYWVKHLNEISIIDTVFGGFLDEVKPAEFRTMTAIVLSRARRRRRPVRSINSPYGVLADLVDGAKVKAGAETPLRGMAFDGGSGIKDVSV